MSTLADQQVYNPLGYSCRPNEASPDYVTAGDFRTFVSYGFIVCWLSHTPDDPNGDCNFARPITREDVLDLRCIFLRVLSDTVYYLWNGDIAPGSGDLDRSDSWAIFINSPDSEDPELVSVEWDASLRNDAICLSMHTLCATSDRETIWLSYSALEKRWYVLATLQEAYATVGQPLAQALIDLVPYVDQLRAAVWLNCDRALDVSSWNEDDCVKWLDAEGAEIPRRQLFCRECDEPMRIDNDGVSHHLEEDLATINYDRDADHVAIREDNEDELQQDDDMPPKDYRPAPAVDVEKALEIAKDVLKRIGDLRIKRETYMTQVGSVPAALDEQREPDLGEVLAEIEPACHVCLLGACLLSKARLFNHLPLRECLTVKREVHIGYGTVRRHLEDIFGNDQMKLLESYFEADNMCDPEDTAELAFWCRGAAVEGARIENNILRLVAALQNFIDNRGSLIVEPVGEERYFRRPDLPDDNDDDDDDDDDDFDDDDGFFDDDDDDDDFDDDDL